MRKGPSWELQCEQKKCCSLWWWWDALLQEEGDDFMSPLAKAGAWVLAASRAWTLAFTSKLHPAPGANVKDFVYFAVGTNPACVPQDSFTDVLILQAALCLHVQCSVTLMSMQDPWHSDCTVPWHQLYGWSCSSFIPFWWTSLVCPPLPLLRRLGLFHSGPIG